jgi:hypothetical protein
MRALRILSATAVVLVIAGGFAAADGGAAGKLPAPARVACGNSGVAGIGFTVYACASGAGRTKYSHPAELLVVRAGGDYMGYPDTFSQADLMVKAPAGEVIASHNDSIVRVTASALQILVDERRLDRLFPGSRHLVAINDLAVNSSGDIFLRANFYAGNRQGCENARAEITAARRLKLLWRSATGLICG